MTKAKSLSILGDSISTYEGVSNDRAARESIWGNPVFYRDPFPAEKTYWGHLLARFGWEICVNNSWSGGNLSGRDDPSSGVCRARELGRDDGKAPDFVIVFMGINDLGRGVSPEVFAADYKRALETVRRCHPRATVVCVTLPDRHPYFKPRCEVFNRAIEKAAQEMGEGFLVADLFHSRLANDTYYFNTVDGLHPDEDGMKIIAEVIGDAIAAHLAK